MDKILEEKLKKAKQASRQMMKVNSQTKNEALELISKALLNHIDEIILENQKDIQNAKDNHMSSAMIDRLLLDEKRIISIANDVKKLIT